jgi:hypothetical protein
MSGNEQSGIISYPLETRYMICSSTYNRYNLTGVVDWFAECYHICCSSCKIDIVGVISEIMKYCWSDFINPIYVHGIAACVAGLILKQEDKCRIVSGKCFCIARIVGDRYSCFIE